MKILAALYRLGILRSLKDKGAFKFFVTSPAQTASPVHSRPKSYTDEERVEQWDYVNSVYFGQERDQKNFPNLVMPDGTPPVRLGIFPASWFDFLYPKTGVSGPYVFGGGLALFMMSKEIMVIDHYFWEIPGFWGAVWFINYKFGAQIRKYFEDKIKIREMIFYTRPLRSMRAGKEENIKRNEQLIEQTETAKHIYQAKREGVELQLEAAYRQRLQKAYEEVKERLDYEAEKLSLKNKFEHEHMVNWIVSNVTKSITAQQESEAIKSCLRTLRGLASKEAKTRSSSGTL